MLWLANSPNLNMIKPCWFYKARNNKERGHLFGGVAGSIGEVLGRASAIEYLGLN
jgi:hypothetical protein